MLSAICETFGCTPAEALEMDPHWAFNILDYRNARATVEQFNSDPTKMTEGQSKLAIELSEAANMPLKTTKTDG